MTDSTIPFAFHCDILASNIPSIHTYDIPRLNKISRYASDPLPDTIYVSS